MLAMIAIQTPANDVQKIKATRIEILWSEDDNLARKPVFATFADAHRETFRAALDHAREGGGGYRKTGFRVTFADGEQYEGRIDIRSGNHRIDEHMRGYLEVHSGRRCPNGRTREEWIGYLDFCVPVEKRETMGRLLDTYQIGD